MTRITNPQTLQRVGIPTPQTVIYKSESHKLHQAFPVKKTEGVPAEIVPGQPVKLNSDGTVEAYAGSGIYLGIAVTDSRYPVYPEGALGPEVTVMVEAFAVVYGKVKELGGASSLPCAYVEPAAKTAGDAYTPYAATGSSGTTPSKFINITPGADVDELIQVIIR